MEKMNLLPREEIKKEYYQYLMYEFSILTAWEFLKKNPREPKGLDLERFKDLINVPKIDGKECFYPDAEENKGKVRSINMGGGYINWKYARDVGDERSEIPGIVLLYSTGKDSQGIMFIDGHHRFAYRYFKGYDQFPVYVIEPDEARQLYPEQIRRLEEVHNKDNTVSGKCAASHG